MTILDRAVSGKAIAEQFANKQRARIFSKDKKTVMDVSLEDVTPELATYWMENLNKNNRAKNAHSIARYAAQMGDGLWLTNGEAIIFGVGEGMLNGQHRALAVIKSGLTVTMLVIRFVKAPVSDKKLFASCDGGNKRTLAHILGTHGVKNSSTVAGMMQWKKKYDNGGVDKSHVHVTNSEGLLMLKEYPEMKESAIIVQPMRDKVGPSIAGFCHYLFSQQNGPLAVQFFDKLTTGLNCVASDPEYILREKLITIRDDKKTFVDPVYPMALFFKAWAGRRDGVALTKSTLKHDMKCAFPVI